MSEMTCFYGLFLFYIVYPHSPHLTNVGSTSIIPALVNLTLIVCLKYQILPNLDLQEQESAAIISALRVAEQ